MINVTRPAGDKSQTPNSGGKLVFLLGSSLFLLVFLFVPQIGPIFRIHTIPASSMAPGVNVGAYIYVSLASYGYSRHSFEWLPLPVSGRIGGGIPARGDIVTFRTAHHGQWTTYVKRVIGLPGDRIQMIAGRLHINGKAAGRVGMPPIPRGTYSGASINIGQWRETLPNGVSYPILEMEGDKGMLDDTSVFEVPENHIFVMGDNRDNSSDSRVPSSSGGPGFVPIENIAGKVIGVWGGQMQANWR